MRLFRQIALSIPMLILLLYGSGGMGILRCACDGHVQILTPSADCCQGETDCMSITVVEVSDAALTDAPSVDVAVLYLPPTQPQLPFALLLHGTAVEKHDYSLPPPVREQNQMVMLV